MITNFLEVLNRICTYRSLNSVIRLQMYVSCKIENDSLEIIYYLSPEIYNEERWPHGKHAA